MSLKERDTMSTNKDQRLAEIDRKIMMQGVYDLPGIFCVAGGLLGKFGEPDEIPFQFLTDPNTTTALLAVGGAIMVWSAVVLFSLVREKSRIQSGRAD
jgi:hypothetical protein